MNEVRSPEDWGDAYAELESTYEAFVDRLDQLLRQLLEDAELDYFETFTWTETVDSLVDRIYRQARSGTHVHDLSADLGDLAGVTVMTHASDGSESVCELIEQEFAVDGNRSLTFAACEVRNADPGSDRTGTTSYTYPRFVISLPDTRRSLPEWRAFESLQAEIRVPTIFQSAWNSIEQAHLPYYLDSSYPAGARDAVRRIAAHLRAADEALVHLARATENAETEYSHAVAQNKLDLELDVPALTAYLAQSETVGRLVAHAERAGMGHVEDEPFAVETQLWLFRKHGLATLRDLDDFLRTGDERAAEIFERIVKLVAREEDHVPWAASESLTDWLVLILNRADAETVALTRYRSSIENAVNTLIGNPAE